jgi:hypothetical protein
LKRRASGRRRKSETELFNRGRIIAFLKDDTVVNTSVQEDATHGIPLIETSYQNNKLVIGL